MAEGRRRTAPKPDGRLTPRSTSVLKTEVLDWLLGKDNPSVRYLALTQLLDRPERDAEVTAARAGIMAKGVVPQILARQGDDGAWEQPERFYTAKYKGTVWQLITLAEVHADGTDKRVKRACEFLLENSQDRESHGFAMHRSERAGGGRHREVIPCLTGNVAWSLIALGYLEEPRVQRAIDWITTYQRLDDRTDKPPQGWPYDRWETCWGRHTCHMGVIKALKALAAIPEKGRSARVRRFLKDGVEFVLKHHVHRRSHDLARVSKPAWLRLGFPLMYQTDILEVLAILTSLDCKDDRMLDAVDVLVSKQDARGRWKLESSFNGRFQVDIERNGKPSKWVTLRALTVLKRCQETTGPSES